MPSAEPKLTQELPYVALPHIIFGKMLLHKLKYAVYGLMLFFGHKKILLNKLCFLQKKMGKNAQNDIYFYFLTKTFQCSFKASLSSNMF